MGRPKIKFRNGFLLDDLGPQLQRTHDQRADFVGATMTESVLQNASGALRRVVIESPFAGDVERNIAYARRCVRDCLDRGEAPIASHLLFTQDGILDDGVPNERTLGIAAGLAWLPVADAMVLYVDHGISPGMTAAMTVATNLSIPVEQRRLRP
jgi:hypothetical protein